MRKAHGAPVATSQYAHYWPHTPFVVGSAVGIVSASAFVVFAVVVAVIAVVSVLLKTGK